MDDLPTLLDPTGPPPPDPTVRKKRKYTRKPRKAPDAAGPVILNDAAVSRILGGPAEAPMDLDEGPMSVSGADPEAAELVDQILKYKAAFPEILAAEKVPSRGASREALVIQLDRMKQIVSSKNNSSLVKLGFVSLMQGYEYIGTEYAHLRIYGIAQATRDSEEIDSILKEIALKHDIAKYVEPEARLAFEVLRLTLVLHGKNKADEHLRAYGARAAPEALTKDFADL